MRLGLRTDKQKFALTGVVADGGRRAPAGWGLSGAINGTLLGDSDKIRPIFDDAANSFVCHDAKRDMLNLSEFGGYRIYGPVHDVAILAHLAGVNEVASIDRSLPLAQQADRILSNFYVLHPRVTEDPKLRDLYVTEMMLSHVLASVERKGIRIDPELIPPAFKNYLTATLGQPVVRSKWRQLSATGRMSSHSPCSTNVPKTFRKAFIPWSDDWILVSIDLSQHELRWLAELSGDEALIGAFLDDIDVHTDTAFDLAGIRDGGTIRIDDAWRRIAKAVSFGIIFGGGASTISKSAGISLIDAQRYLKRWLEKYPRVAAWQIEEAEKLRKIGEARSWFGRVRKLPEALIGDAHAIRQGINHLIQGSAADQFKHMILRIHGILGNTKSWMQNFLHDEIHIQLHQDDRAVLPLVCAAVTLWPNLRVPFKVRTLHSRKSWAEMV